MAILSNLSLLAAIVVVLVSSATVSSHNITKILSANPDFSTFNKYLTDTKLSDEINSRNTITVLALSNAEMGSVTKGNSLSVIKNILSLHVLLDYFDPNKLHGISNGSILTTTLYQATGNAPGNLGFVNITDLSAGKVGFGSAAPNSKLDSSYVKSLDQIPYNISVIQVTDPIFAPGVLTAPAPAPSDVNITAILVKAGCKRFANLLAQTGVIKTYENAVENGLTIYAPNDDAFEAERVPDLSKLTDAELVQVLEYHASSSYSPMASLKTTSSNITTLASSGAGKYVISATSSGNAVTLHTGVSNSRVADTALDMPPLSILVVDSLLLPTELFSLPPAPAPAPDMAPAPSPEMEPDMSPSPAPAPAHSKKRASPPAPLSESPADGPSEALVGSEKSKNGGCNVEASFAVFTAIAAAFLFFY